MRICFKVCLFLCLHFAEITSTRTPHQRTRPQTSKQKHVILSGKVEEFFGHTSGLIKVQKVFKGDHRIEGNHVIFESLRNCPNQNSFRWHLFETRLFYGRFKSPGVFKYFCRIGRNSMRNFRLSSEGNFPLKT